MYLLSVKWLMLRDLAGLNGTRRTLRARRASHPLRRPWLSLSHHQIKHRAADRRLDTGGYPLADATAVEEDLLSLLAFHAALEHEIVGTIDAVLSEKLYSVHVHIIRISRFPVKRNVADHLFLRLRQDFT